MPYTTFFAILYLLLIGACVILFIVFTVLLIFGLRKGKKAKQLYLAQILWLTVSILLPYVAKKYDLIKRRWVRWLLVFISPAAIATIYFPILCFLSMDLACKCRTLGTTGEGISRQFINYHTGVNFPPMSYVTGNFKDCYPDFTNTCTMKLKEKPDQALIQELEQSEKWQKDSNNPNLYKSGSWNVNASETITFDIKKEVIYLEYVKL